MILYQVGGCVRDSILGRKAKDVDLVAVMSADEVGEDPFGSMVTRLKLLGFDIFQERAQFFTVRANFPGGMPFGTTRVTGGVDIVLARRDGVSEDGRHPTSVALGGLGDDLARRDFTMNAVARSSQGDLIDPHSGVRDIKARVIRAVGDPMERMAEDRLRILRALRFAVTLDFEIDEKLKQAINLLNINDNGSYGIFRGVSVERIREELRRMFACSTIRSIQLLEEYWLMNALFSKGTLWLEPTTKQR